MNKCPKCGSTKIKILYLPVGETVETGSNVGLVDNITDFIQPPSSISNELIINKECLFNRCSCGYMELTKTLDEPSTTFHTITTGR